MKRMTWAPFIGREKSNGTDENLSERQIRMPVSHKRFMSGKFARRLALGSFALVGLLSASWATPTQNPEASYFRMAPIERYLMERTVEIAMAKSAAPESISHDAEVLVLGRHGYETTVKGKNGFVCIVERSWTAAYDDPEFLSPKLRYPICLNPPAARSHLPLTLKRTELALAGLSKTQIFDGIKGAFDNKELPLPEPGAMCYMMSKQAYFGASYGHGGPHLMFYFPRAEGANWGAEQPGSPVVVHQDTPDPVTVLVIPLPQWSDGTEASEDAH